jgi:hypothetical protein
MIAHSPGAAATMRERLFEPDIARSKPGSSPRGAGARCAGSLCDRLAFLL